MYAAGLYFVPWSMGVSVGVLLVCLVVGAHWYTTRYLHDAVTYRQAVPAGVAISVCTGVVYAGYNLISIARVYPDFLDQVARARLAHAGTGEPTSDSVAAIRAQVSAWIPRPVS